MTMLGFVNYFRPDALHWALGSSISIDPKGANEFFQSLISQNITMSLKNADGSVENKTLGQIVAEQQAQILEKSRIFAKVQSVLRIEAAKAIGTYQLGSEQHKLDMQAGLVNDKGWILPQDAQVTQAVEKTKLDLTVQTAESMIRDGDIYFGLSIMQGLADEGKIDLEEWTDNAPADIKLKAQLGFKFFQRANELRGQLEEMRDEIAELENTSSADNETLLNEKLLLLCRMVKELETYFLVVGYKAEDVNELAAFRYGIEDIIGVHNLPPQYDIYQEPMNSFEQEARGIIAQRTGIHPVGSLAWYNSQLDQAVGNEDAELPTATPLNLRYSAFQDPSFQVFDPHNIEG